MSSDRITRAGYVVLALALIVRVNFVEGKSAAKVNVDLVGHQWHSPLYYQLDMSEMKRWGRPFTDSGYFFRQGLRCIQDDPLVLVQSLENIPFLFMGNVSWPANQLSVAPLIRLYELLFVSFLLPGLVVWLRSCWPLSSNGYERVLVWAVPILALFICAYVFKSEIRYRVPFDVYFVPVAIRGWMSILLTPT